MKKTYFLQSLQSLKKGVGSGVGAGSGSIIRGTVTDPQHCVKESFFGIFWRVSVYFIGETPHWECTFIRKSSPLSSQL
jgi:hypothetical protein